MCARKPRFTLPALACTLAGVFGVSGVGPGAAIGVAFGQTQADCNAIASRGDYGGGLACMQRLQSRSNEDMRNQERAIVERTMQNPDCQAKYRRFLADGGRLPFDQYAYLYAATRGFTPEGIAFFQQNEARNHQNEMMAWQGVLNAEAARRDAQQERMDHFHDNQFGAGLGLQGRGEYVDPNGGRPVILQNTRPNVPTQDRATGQWYVMDERGNYFVQQPGGQWVPMQRGR